MSINQLPSGQWQVRWYDASGRRRTASYRTKKQAQDAYARAVDERAKGEVPVRRKTLAQYLPGWEATTRERVEPSTWKHAYEPHIRLYILPAFGDVYLNRIDPLAVQEFIDGLAARTPKLSAETRRRIFATLRLILNTAAAHGYRPPLPRDAVSLPNTRRIEEDAPTILQIHRLAEAIDPDYRLAVLLGGYCGLRAGEVFALNVSDVDWDRHRIRVRRSRENHSGAEKTPKSGDGRWVTMTQPVEEAMRVHLAEYPPDRDGYLWRTRAGTFVSHSNFYARVWKPARAEAGLPGLKFHSLRHAAPTIMALAGWSAKRVQLELGHSSASFTLDRYGHLFHEEDVAARERMNDVLAAALADAKHRTHLGHVRADG